MQGYSEINSRLKTLWSSTVLETLCPLIWVQSLRQHDKLNFFIGWSFIEILESENSSFNSEDPCVLYRTQSNFESTIWQRELRKASMPVCCMNAGMSF